MKKCLAILTIVVLFTACGSGNGSKPVVDSLPDDTNFNVPNRLPGRDSTAMDSTQK